MNPHDDNDDEPDYDRRLEDDESRLEAIEAQIEERQCELDDQWLEEAWLDEMERANRGQIGGDDGNQ
jgi:hypothetical protein